jgi:hypothetical protein
MLYRRVTRMKRFAMSMLLALSAVVVTVGSVFADGWPHGG